MKRIFVLCAAFFLFATIATAAAYKVMLLEPADYPQSCILGSNDIMNVLKPNPTNIVALGTITTGSCADAWTYGVNFSYGREGIQNQKVTKGCEKRNTVHVNATLNPGHKLDNWDPSPVGATANPCLHTDGLKYRKYDVTD